MDTAEITQTEERQARYLAASGFMANLACTDSMEGAHTFPTMAKALEAAAEWADSEWMAYLVEGEVIV